MKEDYLTKDIKPKKKQIAKYIGETEVYFPAYKKIVKQFDVLEEMSIEEAKSRDDFIVVYK